LPEFLGDVEQVRITALARIASPAVEARPDESLTIEQAHKRLGVSKTISIAIGKNSDSPAGRPENSIFEQRARCPPKAGAMNFGVGKTVQKKENEMKTKMETKEFYVIRCTATDEYYSACEYGWGDKTS